MLPLALSLVIALQVASPGAEKQTTPRELIRNQVRTTVQNELQQTRTLREQKRQEFQEKLQRMYNERQQDRLQNLNNRFGEVSQNMLEHNANTLDRLRLILEKLEARAEALENEGTDTAAIVAQIADAREKITIAENKLVELGNETFVLEIDEKNLGHSIKEQILDLKNQMAEVKTSVNDARESVGKVIRLLKEASNEN